MYEETRARGLRRRGEAADHARHLRALLRLLRRLLRPGAEGPHPDRRGLRRRLRGRRLRRHPDLALGRLRARREDRRPAGDVPERLLHRADEPRRDPGDLDPGRAWRRRRAPARARRASRSASRSPPRPSASRSCWRPPTRSRARSASPPPRATPLPGREGPVAELEAVIGLEIHVQLATRTKMFCGCELSFGDEPNVHTCPICLAHPGVLPVPNEEAIRYGAEDRPGARLRDRPALDLPPQELLLSRQPEGLPDQSVRHPDLRRREARRHPHHPRPPRGGRGEDDPRRRLGPDPRLDRLAGRLQPRRHAAGRDRHRARPARRRRSGRVGAPAARDGPPARRLRREHGGGEPADRRQRLGAPGRLDRARGRRPS